MARKPKNIGMWDGLLLQIGNQVARGVAEGITRSGIIQKLGRISRTSSVAGVKKRAGRRSAGPKTCSAHGCREEARASGMCSKHYQRARYAKLHKKSAHRRKK